MKEKSITWKQFVSFRPCYKGEEFKELREFAKTKPRWTALDILGCKQFPAKDRLWLVLREELIDAKTLRLLACDFAERSLKRKRKAGREPSQASWDAVAVARKFAAGEATSNDLRIALAAAAKLPVAVAAAAAAYADDAAAAAAYAAAAAAAAYADDAAAAAAYADDAAAAAERRWQVARTIRVLKALHG